MNAESTYLLSLMMIILMKIVCFILGYLTIKLGYYLISSGVKGEFKFSANIAGVKADLASVSPGLLFVLLGVLLIGFAIFVEKGVTMEKKSRENIEEPTLIIPEKSPFENSKKNILNKKEEKNERGKK